MKREQQCPGYFERDDQEIIEAKGPNFTSYLCALCGQQIMPVHKDGGWVPEEPLCRCSNQAKPQQLDQGRVPGEICASQKGTTGWNEPPSSSC